MNIEGSRQEMKTEFTKKRMIDKFSDENGKTWK